MLGNICLTKKCQLQAILNMTTTLNVSLNLIRKMFPVVHTRLGPSFFSTRISKKKARKAVYFTRLDKASEPSVPRVPGFGEAT